MPLIFAFPITTRPC